MSRRRRVSPWMSSAVWTRCRSWRPSGFRRTLATGEYRAAESPKIAQELLDQGQSFRGPKADETRKKRGGVVVVVLEEVQSQSQRQPLRGRKEQNVPYHGMLREAFWTVFGGDLEWLLV